MTGDQTQVERALASFSTPFNVPLSAEQSVQFSIDPNQGLTARRYQWYSNGSMFDSTLLSEVEAGIRLETSATGSDVARIHSSISGQYIAQTLARPGAGLIIDDGNVEIDQNHHASLTHGAVYVGAFWWDSTNTQVDTGIGYKWDSTGWYFFVKSNGVHLGDSPVPQSEFDIDPFDLSGPGGQIADPSSGYVYNWPYTWYNQGPFEAGFLSPISNRLEETNRFVVNGRPSTATPNFPIQLVISNEGTASQLGVELGGMQYSTYGGSIADIEFRETDETRVTAGQNYISPSKSLTQNAIDPSTEPGVPLVSFQRDSGERDLALLVQELFARPISDDIYIYQWDEWNPSTALTGASFTDPVTPNNAGRESKIVTDTQATGYTPSSSALLRSVRFFEGGTKNKTGEIISQRTDTRVEIDATRVITAVNDGDSTADVDPFFVKVEESY